jgi:hypothetical protein
MTKNRTMSNIGQFRMCCQNCDSTHYGLTRTTVCLKCERKHQKAEEKFQKRYAKVLYENPDYFTDAEELADGLMRLCGARGYSLQ